MAIAAAKRGTSLGTALRRVGANPMVRRGLAAALAARGINVRAPGKQLAFGGRRRRGRGITALELRGFRKVATLLDRYFRMAPRAMKRTAFGHHRRRRR